MKKSFFEKKFFISLGVIVVCLVVWGFVANGNNGKMKIKVERGKIYQKIKVAGKVKAYGEVDLGFDSGGRVARSFFVVGDKVSAGDTIATLDLTQILAEISKERALLDQELIKLEEVKKNSPASLSQYQDNLISAIYEGYAVADNEVRNKADQFFKTPRVNPKFEITIIDGNFEHYFYVSPDTVAELNSDRKVIEDLLNKWQADLSELEKNDISQFASKAVANMNFVSDFLDDISLAVNSFVSDDYSYDSTVSGYKTSIGAARSAIATARGKIISAQQNLSSAPVIVGGGEVSSIISQEAKVNQIKSSIAVLEAMLRKSSITAPFDGIITKQDAKIGETISIGQSLVSLISPGVYVEANVSEININKVAVGNKVILKFDAFPGEVFNGFVSYIEPGDVIIDGVVNYKIRIELGEISTGDNNQLIMEFTNFDSKIKNGLTTDVEIEVMKKENVLFVPLFAISKEGDKSYIYKIKGAKITKDEIKTGITGSDGMVEVIAGLAEGDVIQFDGNEK